MFYSFSCSNLNFCGSVIDLFEYMDEWRASSSTEDDLTTLKTDDEKIEEILAEDVCVLESDIVYCLQDSLMECDYGDLRYGFKVKQRKLEDKGVGDAQKDERENGSGSDIDNRNNMKSGTKRNVDGEAILLTSKEVMTKDKSVLTPVLLKYEKDESNPSRVNIVFPTTFPNAYLYYPNRQPKLCWRLNIPNDYNRRNAVAVNELAVDFDSLQDDFSTKVMNWSNVVEDFRLTRTTPNAETFIKELCVLNYLKTECPPPDPSLGILILDHTDVCYDKDHIYCFSDYYDQGNLWNRIEESENMTEPEARYWTKQVLNNVKYFHEVAGICHRDLSPENVIIKGSKCLLSDFGKCVQVPYKIDENTGKRIYSKLFIEQQEIRLRGGCLPYTPPEVVHNPESVHDMFAYDMWSVGIMVFNMFVGNLPFEMPSNRDHYDAYVQRLSIRMRITQELGLVSDEALSFIRKLLNHNPQERITVQEALQDDWLIGQNNFVYVPPTYQDDDENEGI